MKRVGNNVFTGVPVANASFNYLNLKAAFSMRSVFSAAAVFMTCGNLIANVVRRT
jgi:hypothetical protein